MKELVPGYERSAADIGVIHYGVGAFHRGHQAVYFDDALRSGLGAWGIYGVSPRSPEVTSTLRDQRFCYTVNARQDKEQDPRIVGSIYDGSLFDLENPGLLSAILAPQLKVLTITVTEKAYVANREATSMPNRILDLLGTRFRGGLSAPALISCDNLSENGGILRQVLAECAELRELDSDFRTWLDGVSMPHSMVDRIVPAITPAAIDEFESQFGYRDRSLISTEPFRQWVVQPHPGSDALASFGIEISDEVARFERLKLRIFNGAHSTNAYFSQLSGLEFVYQAMAIPSWAEFIKELQIEISASFEPPTSINVQQYAATARARMANSAVAHRSAQIAMDGSAKLAQRLFGVVNFLSEQGQPHSRVSFAIALWIRFVQSGLPITDPLVDELTERARRSNDLEAVRLVMQTPGLANPVHESNHQGIADFVTQLRKHSPLDVAANL